MTRATRTPSDESDKESEKIDEEESEEGSEASEEDDHGSDPSAHVSVLQCATCHKTYKSKFFHDRHVKAASCKPPVPKKSKVQSDASRRKARRIEIVKQVVDSQTLHSPGPAKPTPCTQVSTQSAGPRSISDQYQHICTIHPNFRRKNIYSIVLCPII